MITNTCGLENEVTGLDSVQGLRMWQIAAVADMHVSLNWMPSL